MASFHLHVKTVSRSAGRSATAAAAYRAGARIVDERTGELHDYRRRGDVEHAQIVLPSAAPAWAGERSALWNAAEAAERRKNSVVAREFEVALPHELPAASRRALALEFAGELAERHGAAADVAVHAPGRGGDTRNHHAHILLTTRRLSADGLTEKTRELDDARSGEVKRWRERWADLQNERLREHGVSERVDHRTLADRGVGRAAQVHLGPKAAAMQRRGADTDRGRLSAEAGQRRASALERMSDKQLRAAIGSMNLPDPERLAQANKAVAGLAGEASEAQAAAAAARTKLKSARTAETQWRQRHRVRAWLQDRVGVGGGAAVRERQALERAVALAAERAAQRARAWQREHRQLKAAIQASQAGPRAWRQAQQLELRARERERGVQRALERERTPGRDRGLER